MNLDRIQTILKEYKPCLGRCNHLNVEMAILERQIETIRNDTVETLAAPKPKPMTDMPRGTQIGNPTEKYGGMLADGFKTGEQILLEAKLAKLTDEYNDKISTVDYVNSWMSGLTDRERLVIKSNMIEGMTWKETVTAFNTKFNDEVGKDTLKRLRDRALDKICEIAK